MSKNTALLPDAFYLPYPLDVSGAYNVNSSSGCFHLSSFRPGALFFCPNAPGAPWLVCLATILPEQQHFPLQRRKHPFACHLLQKPFDYEFSPPIRALVPSIIPLYTRQQKRRRLRSKRKQQCPGKKSYTEYGRRHTRELTRKKLMNARQKVNARDVHSVTMDGNIARRTLGLVRPESHLIHLENQDAYTTYRWGKGNLGYLLWLKIARKRAHTRWAKGHKHGPSRKTAGYNALRHHWRRHVGS